MQGQPFSHLSKTPSPVAKPNKLMSNRTVVLPRPGDQLWIVIDGAIKNHDIGATLYVTREGRPFQAHVF